LKIIVDHREPKSIIQTLRKLGLIIDTQQLPIGDYILSEHVIVERKRGRDFVQSLYDGRLFNQITQLVEQYERPLLIIEEFQLESEEYKQAYGALSYLMIFKNIPIIPTSSGIETAHLIERLTSWVQEDHEDPVLSRGGPKRLTNRDKQLYFLQGLDGVGLKTAKYLLDELQSPFEIINSILDSEILFTKTGNPKGISGQFANMRGIGHRFIKRNKQLLMGKEND
jgi:ERCC4-type nuclease